MPGPRSSRNSVLINLAGFERVPQLAGRRFLRFNYVCSVCPNPSPVLLYTRFVRISLVGCFKTGLSGEVLASAFL